MRVVQRALATGWVVGLSVVAWKLAPTELQPQSVVIHAAPAHVAAPVGGSLAAAFVVDRTVDAPVLDVSAPSPVAVVATPAQVEVPVVSDPPPAADLLPYWTPSAGIDGHPEAAVSFVSQARSAFVYDVDAASVLYERAADDPRPVASLTKLVSSLAMSTENPDLNAPVCVDDQFSPNRAAGHTHLRKGECYRGWDILGAALVASDNKAAYGLQVLSGLPFDEFVKRMDEVSAHIGMTRSQWADPSGLEDDNLSTARDITRAVLAVSTQPQLSVAATAPFWSLQRQDGKLLQRLNSTNKLVARGDVEFLAAKTGYTDTAGYCFSTVVRLKTGRTIAMTVLGERRPSDRWRDVAHILDSIR